MRRFEAAEARYNIGQPGGGGKRIPAWVQSQLARRRCVADCSLCRHSFLGDGIAGSSESHLYNPAYPRRHSQIWRCYRRFQAVYYGENFKLLGRSSIHQRRRNQPHSYFFHERGCGGHLHRPHSAADIHVLRHRPRGSVLESPAAIGSTAPARQLDGP